MEQFDDILMTFAVEMNKLMPEQLWQDQRRAEDACSQEIDDDVVQ